MVNIALETALKAVLDAALDGTVSTGIGYADLTPPHVIASAQSGVETPVGTGNFEMEALVEVRSPADPKGAATLEAHNTLLSAVYAALQSGTLTQDLTAAHSPFHCFGVHDFRAQSTRFEDHCWTSGVRFLAYCATADL